MIAGQPTIDDPAYAWDLVRVFPRQGEWQPEEYLVINRLTNHFVELHDGRIEVLEMPTKQHQKIAFRLATLLESHLGSSGEVVMAPYPLYVSEKTYREPDVIVALGAHREWLRDDYAEGADLVVEVLSQDRSRDLVIKREEYARAGIREYWLVDTRESRITVLTLQDAAYVTHSEAGAGGAVASALLPDFRVDVSAALAA